MRDLGTLGGSASSAHAVNSTGGVAGQSWLAGHTASHAFYWTIGGGIQGLGTLGGTHSGAIALNDAGAVTGHSQIPGNAWRAFYWTAGTGMINLGTLGGFESFARALNQAGAVAGVSSASGNAGRRVFYWTASGGMQDVGTLPGYTDSDASGMNDAGTIAGYSWNASTGINRAFVWSPTGGMQDIGTLPGFANSWASAINSSGVVVGSSWNYDPYEERAFVWTAGGGMKDVFSITGMNWITHLNDNLQVTGYRQDLEGYYAATLHLNSYSFAGFLRPVENLPTVNVAKSGSAIPVKFSLGGNHGMGIMETGYPRSQAMSCDLGAPQDAVEETVSAGGSTLSYDSASEQYVYVWKTEKGWTGCRQLIVRLNDGTERRADFRFTR